MRRMLGDARLAYAIGLAGLIATLAIVVTRAREALGFAAVGLDLHPEYYAGKALLERHSVYADKAFVYPPTAALPWALVSKALSYHQAVVAAAYLQGAFIAMTLIGVAYLAMSASPWWLVVGDVAAILVLKGDFGVNAIWLENTSVFLVPLVGLIIWCILGRRWGLMAVALAVSFLIKPLLLPFVVVLVVVRRWKELALALGVPLLLSLAALPLVSSFGTFATVVRRVAQGSNLIGSAAIYNDSLSGLGSYHHVDAPLVDLLRLMVVAVVVAVVFDAWKRRSTVTTELVAIGTCAYVALLLAGSLAEVHYEFAALPGLLFVLLAARSWLVRTVLALAGFIAAFSSYYAHMGGSNGAEQARAALFEMLLLGGSAAAAGLSAKAVPQMLQAMFQRSSPTPTAMEPSYVRTEAGASRLGASED